MPVQITSSAVKDRTHGGQIFPTVVVDISKRKKMETDLRQRDQHLAQASKLEAIGRLAGGIAHDFNNLITGIRGISEDLQSQMPEGSSMHQDTEFIVNACQRAFSITRQLLAFSRRQSSQPTILDLNTVIQNMQALVRPTLPKNIQSRNNLCSRPAAIRADEGHIEQILTNLIINARDAMPEGGCLEIRTTIEGPHVRLCVSDTGVGMAPDVLDHIFEPFFSTKGQKGNGLGLATVYGLVQQNSGQIRVHSQLGKGSQFELLFPYSDDRPHSDRRRPGMRQVRNGNETILLVEDDEIVRRATHRLLCKHGYDVLVAPHGHDALQLCDQHRDRIELLVTDVIMPGIDGSQLAQEVRKRIPDVAILYMSGYSGDILKEHHLKAPRTGFIEKRHVAANLAYRVRALLDTDKVRMNPPSPGGIRHGATAN